MRFAVVAAVVLLAAACRTGPQSQAEALHPDILLVLPGAQDIRYSSANDGAVSYRLAEPYPADGIMKAIVAKLEGAGWRPVKEDLFNPGLTNSHERGWMNYIDGTKGGAEVFMWSADWEAPRGDRVTYALKYEYPKGAGPISPKPLLEVRRSTCPLLQ
jgi:hypothetical protein